VADQELPQFSDGSAYERNMGTWSRLAGEVFIDWLASPAGLQWVDVGCGNGTFTELLIEQCAPATIKGVDPSESQLAYAHNRPMGQIAEFAHGDAMALPFPDSSFDVATMALTLYFVPDPTAGVIEMARVVRPGGLVAAYNWDFMRGGFPFVAIQDEMRELGVTPRMPPRVDHTRMETTRELWAAAGLCRIETKEIQIQRTFASFDDFWTISTTGSTGPVIEQMLSTEAELLKAKVRVRLAEDAVGRITCSAKAIAIKGRVPN
jgi:ubiquinone/menaquinone biosynthesis C-methylase UbiE